MKSHIKHDKSSKHIMFSTIEGYFSFVKKQGLARIRIGGLQIVIVILSCLMNQWGFPKHWKEISVSLSKSHDITVYIYKAFE